MKNLLGGKGANLAEMCRLGITVPSGFTISTEACTAFTMQGREHVTALIKRKCCKVHCVHRTGNGQARLATLQPLAAVGSLRCARLHARHDGHHFESGPQR
jgi:hypothetical protein